MSINEIRLLHIGHDLDSLGALLDALNTVRTPVRYDVTRVDNAQAAADIEPQVILLDFLLGQASFDALDTLVASGTRAPIIAVAPQGSDALAVEALRHGASDFLALDDPLTAPLLDRAVRCVIERVTMAHALGDSEARYNLMTDNAADMIARLTPAGVFTYLSPACGPLLGFQPDELVGVDVREIFHPDDLPAVSKTYQLALTTTGRGSVTYRMRTKAGGYVWLETTAHSLRNSRGEVEEIITASRDVTERKLAQDQLRASEERFVRAFRASPISFMVIRLSTLQILDINESCERLFGYARAEAIGRTTVELGLWVDLRQRQTLIDAIIKKSAIRDLEAQFRTRDGQVIDGLVSAELVELDGEPCGLQMIYDITERKRAESQMRDSERFARSTLDALTEQIAILDRRGTIVALNRAWIHCEPHMCWTAGLMEGTPYLDFCELATGPEGKYGRAIAAGIRSVMNGSESHFNYEYVCERASGEETWYSVDVTPYLDDPRYSVVVAHLDITARVQAENARRAIEERFRHALNNLPDAFVIYDAQRRIRFMNQVALQMMGLPEAQLLGKRGEDLLPPETVSEYLPHLERAYATRRPQHHDTLYQAGDDVAGSRALSVNYVPQLDENGHVYEMLSISHDISEHRRAEQAEQEQRTLAEALRDTTATLTSTLDLQTVMVRILDNVGRVVAHDAANIMLIEANSARAAYWQGYDAEHADYFARERFPLDWPKIRAMQSGETMLVPDISQEPDWYPLPLSANPLSTVGVPIRSRDKVIGFLNLESMTSGFFNEAHADRLRAFADYAAIAIENAQLYETMRYYAAELEQRVELRTQEMQRAKEHVEAILNSRSDAVILTFLTGIVRQVNPAFAELFGYEPGDVVGASLEMLADENGPDVLLALNDVIASNQPRRLECVMRRKNGTSFDADAMLSPVQNGKLLGIVCSVRDISARKQMEQDLRRAYEKERELGELKSRFVSMASHEFRSPLSTILASSDLLRHYSHKMSEERRSEHFDNIQETIHHLTRLIDDVLMLGRAEANRMETHLVPTELIQFFEEITSELASTSGATGSPIYFNATVPVLTTLADRKLLRQVVTNLLSNAVKYSPNATPVYFKVSRDGDEAVISVQDQGIGIPANDHDHLFEAFHRGANVEGIEGTGLGLAIIQRAVKLHNGTIDFESEVGAGTTFTVRIPIMTTQGSADTRDIEVGQEV